MSPDWYSKAWSQAFFGSGRDPSSAVTTSLGPRIANAGPPRPSRAATWDIDIHPAPSRPLELCLMTRPQQEKGANHVAKANMLRLAHTCSWCVYTVNSRLVSYQGSSHAPLVFSSSVRCRDTVVAHGLQFSIDVARQPMHGSSHWSCCTGNAPSDNQNHCRWTPPRRPFTLPSTMMGTDAGRDGLRHLAEITDRIRPLLLVIQA